MNIDEICENTVEGPWELWWIDFPFTPDDET